MKKLIWLVMVLVGWLGAAEAAEPSKSIMQLPIPLSSGPEACNPTLKEFVSTGLRPGKWEKVSDGQWLYRITSSDVITGRKQKGAISFVINKQYNIVIVDKVYDGRRYLELGGLANFIELTIKSLPSYQICLVKLEAEKKRIAEEKALAQAKIDAEMERINAIEAKKTEKILQERLAVEAKARAIREKEEAERYERRSREARAIADQMLIGEYRISRERGAKSSLQQLIIKKAGDGIGVQIHTSLNGKTVCNIASDNPEVTITKSKSRDEFIAENYSYVISLNDEANDCFIKINAQLSEMWGNKVLMQYKGSCESYCDSSMLTKNVFTKNVYPTSDGRIMEDIAFKQREAIKEAERKKTRWK